MSGKAYQQILSTMREKLLQMRQQTIARQKESLKNISGTARRQDGFDVPFQGNGTGMYVSRINIDKQRIVCINRAIELIDQGKYGLCQNCGKPIPLSRLEVMPFAQYCTGCQSAFEK